MQFKISCRERKGRAPSCIRTISPVTFSRAFFTLWVRVSPPRTIVQAKGLQTAEISFSSLAETVTIISSISFTANFFKV